MVYVDTSKPSSMPNTKPAASAKPNIEPALKLSLEQWRKDMDEDSNRVQTADLSKVKVW